MTIEITINGINIRGYFQRKGKRSSLFEIHAVYPDHVEMHAAGGGFTFTVPIHEFLAEFEPADVSVMRPFYTGFDESPIVFRAYTDGVRWNGWAVPHFTLDQVMYLVEHPEALGDVKFDEELDQVTFYYGYGTESFVSSGQDIETTEGVKHLYLVGDGLCWNLDDWAGGGSEE